MKESDMNSKRLPQTRGMEQDISFIPCAGQFPHLKNEEDGTDGLEGCLALRLYSSNLGRISL